MSLKAVLKILLWPISQLTRIIPESLSLRLELSPGSSGTILDTQDLALLDSLQDFQNSNVLIAGSSKYDCKLLADSLYLNQDDWRHINSIDEIKAFGVYDTVILLAPGYEKNPKIQKIIRWAIKSGYLVL